MTVSSRPTPLDILPYVLNTAPVDLIRSPSHPHEFFHIGPEPVSVMETRSNTSIWGSTWVRNASARGPQGDRPPSDRRNDWGREPCSDR